MSPFTITKKKKGKKRSVQIAKYVRTNGLVRHTHSQLSSKLHTKYLVRGMLSSRTASAAACNDITLHILPAVTVRWYTLPTFNHALQEMCQGCNAGTINHYWKELITYFSGHHMSKVMAVFSHNTPWSRHVYIEMGRNDRIARRQKIREKGGLSFIKGTWVRSFKDS
jgi:hypothetical protein